MSTGIADSNDIRLLVKLLKSAVVIVIIQIIFLNYVTTTKSFQMTSMYDDTSGGTSLSVDSWSSSVKSNDQGNDGKPVNIRENNNDSSISLVEMALDLLGKAGVELDDKAKEEVTSSLGKSNYFELYGREPIVLGKESCQVYRDNVPAAERFAAPMGMFNTGTNLMYKYLQGNCAIKAKQKKYGEYSKGIRLQPSWGKHSPSVLRGKNKASMGGLAPYEHFFPVVILKDPFTFMSSLCRHWYQADWIRFGFRKNMRCPNLTPNNEEELSKNLRRPTVSVNVKFKDYVVKYTSMVDLWNTWYDDYVLKVDFPRMIVRFEDFLFHTEEIVTQVCDCIGGEMNSTFSYEADSSKPIPGASNLLTSVLKYANTDNRFKEFSEQDKEYAMKNLRPDLMEMFHYQSKSQ